MFFFWGSLTLTIACAHGAIISEADNSAVSPGHILRCYGNQYWDGPRRGLVPRLVEVSNLAQRCTSSTGVSPGLCCGLPPAQDQPMTFINDSSSPMEGETYFLNAQICHTKCSCLPRQVGYNTPALLPIANQTLRYSFDRDRLRNTRPYSDETGPGLVLYGATPQSQPTDTAQQQAAWQISQVAYYGERGNRPICAALNMPVELQHWLIIHTPAGPDYDVESLCTHTSFGGRANGNLGGVCLHPNYATGAAFDIAHHRRSPQFTTDFYDVPPSLSVQTGLSLVKAYCRAACSCLGEAGFMRAARVRVWKELIDPSLLQQLRI